MIHEDFSSPIDLMIFSVAKGMVFKQFTLG